jgi:PA14 domain
MRFRPTVSLASLVALLLGGTSCAGFEEEMHPEVLPVVPAAGICASQPEADRMCGCVYDVPIETRYIPDFAVLRPLEMLCTDRLAMSLRRGPPGFPGVTGRYEWFGVDLAGDVEVRQAGVYAFRLTSDDGAKLYVDDALVLNNDGRHDVQAVEGSVALTPGVHRVHVPFYNGPGPMALELEVARPGGPWETLRVDQPL